MKSRIVLFIFIALLAPLMLTACGERTEKVDAKAIYEQLNYGMSYEEVAELIPAEPSSTTEGQVNVPIGEQTLQSDHKTVSWRLGKTLIIAIFENNKMIAKDITQMP